MRPHYHQRAGTCWRQRVVTVSASQAQLPPPKRPPPTGRVTPTNAPPPPRPEGGPYQQQQQQQGPWMPPPGPPQYASSSQQQQQPFGSPPGSNQQQPPGPNPSRDILNNYARALIAGAFVCGLGVGVYYDSEVVLSPQNLSSTQLIDRGSPNSDVCMAYGYSSSVFDMKLYVTYNPFNVYVTQPVIKSGCVLRRANVGILERENLVEKKDVENCKQRMNTFAFTGDLKNAPEVSCVYHSEEAENQYLSRYLQGPPPNPSKDVPAAAAGAASQQAKAPLGAGSGGATE